MPIGPAAGDESKSRSAPETIDVLDHVTWMPYLDTVEAQLNERFEPRATTVASWMRPDGKGTGFMRDSYCVSHLESLFRDERWSTGAEVAVERVAEVPG